jgi:5-formyltetrahydrofolate cyclo-ligase
VDKVQLRQLYKRKRRELDPVQLRDCSAKIGEHLAQSLPLINKLVHVYLPIRKLQEIDTYLIKDVLQHTFPSCRFALSRSNFETGELEHVLWEKDTIIDENQYGIPEPTGGKSLDPVQLDIVLVPLLAFDHHGHRVGYGKGFYDRFLAKCRPDCIFAGLSHFPPCDAVIIPDDWDIALHKCFTPDKVYVFGR